jgi:hypothetical protein
MPGPANGLVLAVVLGLAETFDDRCPGIVPGLRPLALEFVSAGLGGGLLGPCASQGTAEDFFGGGRLAAGVCSSPVGSVTTQARLWWRPLVMPT